MTHGTVVFADDVIFDPHYKAGNGGLETRAGLFDDVMDCLNSLRPEYYLALVSDEPQDRLNAKVADYRLNYFKNYVGKSKENDKRRYLIFVKDPDDYILKKQFGRPYYVCDDLKDIVMANEVGVAAIGIARYGLLSEDDMRSAGAKHVIKSLSTLEGTLQRTRRSEFPFQ